MVKRMSQEWEPVKGEIMTRWVNDVNPESPLPEYPRPQLERNEWLNLNGLWNYAIRPKSRKKVDSYDGKILVPFAVESALSGVKKKLSQKQKLWYQRVFSIPKDWNGKRIILHFGAVDWETSVWVNNKEVGKHKGGYVPFSFDVTDCLKENGENELIVSVWDPTNKGGVERGKQTLKPRMIKYTAVSGIWQTVWIEPVSESYIKSLKVVPDIDDNKLDFRAIVFNSDTSDVLEITVLEEKTEISTIKGNPNKEIAIKVPNPKLWNTGNPFLYDLSIKLVRNGQVLDEVSSYFGMRKISVMEDDNGVKRLALNNEILFQYGTLDQGYWPDGLYTAPTDEALKYDIDITRELGFNMIRKHVKVEPARWYYHCDKMGMLVWQDMPNGGKMSLFRMVMNMIFKREEDRSKTNFYNELEEMIDAFHNYPCIVVWVPFNEGWGQFDTEQTTNKVKNQDPSRLVNEASGWYNRGSGDICDCHKYVGPCYPKDVQERVAVCGEFGGLGCEIDDHMWKKKFKFVYKKFESIEEMTLLYGNLIAKIKEFKEKGLSAGIYTQITDVEGEVNGLLTYDREVVKMNSEKIREINSSAIQD